MPLNVEMFCNDHVQLVEMGNKVKCLLTKEPKSVESSTYAKGILSMELSSH